MRVEVFYIADCPNWQTATREIQEIARALGFRPFVDASCITSEEEAKESAFLGSPAVRVNGRDVEPGAPDGPAAYGCRVYYYDGRFHGAPARAWLRAALTKASREERKP
jgi:hypothetical protein